MSCVCGYFCFFGLQFKEHARIHQWYFKIILSTCDRIFRLSNAGQSKRWRESPRVSNKLAPQQSQMCGMAIELSLERWKVLVEWFKLKLSWLCLPFIHCCFKQKSDTKDNQSKKKKQKTVSCTHSERNVEVSENIPWKEFSKRYVLIKKYIYPCACWKNPSITHYFLFSTCLLTVVITGWGPGFSKGQEIKTSDSGDTLSSLCVPVSIFLFTPVQDYDCLSDFLL